MGLLNNVVPFSLIAWAQVHIESGLASILTDDTAVTQQLMLLMCTGYAFKFVCALLDTIPLYWLVPRLSRWLAIDPLAEHRRA